MINVPPDEPIDENELIFNGINGETGEYLLPAMSPTQIADIARGKPLAAEDLKDVKIKSGPNMFPLVEGKDPRKLDEAGWSVVFPAAAKGSEQASRNAAIREALSPLLDHRRAQATRQKETYYREFEYRPKESKSKFLSRLGAGPGPADPDHVPYYMLLVGSPEEIPFRVQYQVDVQYAVGRIHFDELDDYETYAKAVVAAETGEVFRGLSAAFFGVKNPRDGATRLSHDYLVGPLADHVASAEVQGNWDVRRFMKEDATVSQLGDILGGTPPAFLFTGSHGVGFASGSDKQLPYQGALLCQDWGGPKGDGLSRDHYFAAENISSGTDLRGMIAFHFACYGAGTPSLDEFTAGRGKKEKAPHPFLARLPCRLLTAGALAAIGHVDRAWGTSFMWLDGEGKGKPQQAVFRSAIKRLLEGAPIGYAMDDFNLRYAEMASDLTNALEEIDLYDEDIPDKELAKMWIAQNDARNYAVIGDPAVRLILDPDTAIASGTSVAGHLASSTAGAAPSTTKAKKPMDIDTPSASDPTAASFGIFGGKDKGDDQPGVFASLAKKVADTLSAAITDAMSLEVKTYTSKDVGQAVEEGGSLATSANAQLRAFTRSSLDGDTEVCVPVNDDGVVDENLWTIHKEVVGQAQTHRDEMLKMVLGMISGVFK